MVYHPGKTQNAADAISRCKPLHMMYVSAGQHHHNTRHGVVKELLEVDLKTIHAAMNLVKVNKENTMMSSDQVHRATQEDGVLVRLMDHIQRGMPDSGLELDKDLREYHRYRHDLHVVRGVLCYRGRIVIPKVLREY